MIAPLIYHRKNPAFLRAGMETFSNIFSQRFQRPDNAFTHRLNGHALGLGNLGSTHAHKEKGIEALGLLVRQGGKGGVQLGHDQASSGVMGLSTASFSMPSPRSRE